MTKNCEICGKAFRTFPSEIKIGQGRFCSRKCKGIAQSTRIERECEICGKSFSVGRYFVAKGHGRYCSLPCRDKAHNIRIELNCLVCGKPIRKPPCKVKTGRGKYCSRACKGIAQSQYQLGEGGPNWRGGSQNPRDTWGYREWRKTVYARDNWACRDCGRKDKIHAHHIFSFAEFPEHRLELWNGVTLCRKCHAKCHPELPMICALVS